MAEHKRPDNDHDAIMEIHTVLLGANGDDGLVGDVKRCMAKQEKQDEELSTVKKVLYTLIGLLIGGGVITGSAFGIDKIITK